MINQWDKCNSRIILSKRNDFLVLLNYFRTIFRMFSVPEGSVLGKINEKYKATATFSLTEALVFMI